MKKIKSKIILLFSFIYFLLITNFVCAEIISEQNASLDQKAIIDSAPNNIPLIQIAPPNQNGISHNRYDVFDIETKGAILNNSANPTQTQLSGYVVGNDRFRPGQSANIILNEVRSSNSTLLQGFLEVSGNRAEVIIANPNGITCSGCGFINTNRAILTTGLITWSAHDDVTGFNVQQGEIIIDGHGLNALQTDQAALLAEIVRINATVSANELNIITGQNYIEHQTFNPNKSSTVTRTGISLDISSLGGMYANKIHLIGTQDGMGVRSYGTIASAGDFSINNNGVIELNGHTQINGTTHIQTKNKFVNNGTIASGATIDVVADNVEQKGTWVAGVTSLHANNFLNAGEIDTVNGYFYIHDTFINQNNGLIYSLGDLFFAKDVNGNKIDLFINQSAKIESENNLFIAANLLLNKRTFFAWDEREISRIQHRDKIQDDPNCTWKCSYTRNDYDDIYTESFIRSDSTASSEIIAGADITLKSNTLSNQYSLIVAGKDLSFSTNNLEELSFQPKKYLKQLGTITHWRKIHVHGDDNDYLVIDNVTQLNSTNLISIIDEPAGRMVGGLDLTGNAHNINIHTEKPNDDTNNTVTSEIVFSGDLIYDNYRLPTANFYHININSEAAYLVETNPRFTQYKSFLSSDYYFEHLGFDLASIQKRLGDGFYEQRLVLEQILKLTGKRYLGEFNSTEEQFLALLDNGIEFSKAFNIRPGMTLSREQLSLLTKDILWMEEKTINGQTVLAPVVYLAHLNQEQLNSSTAIITAKNVQLNASNTFNSDNSNIYASKFLSIQGQDIFTQNSYLNSQLLSISATNDLQNTNSFMKSDAMYLSAGKNILSYGTNISAANDATFIAGQHFLMDSIQTSIKNFYKQNDNQFESINVQQLQSGLSVGKNLNIISGSDAVFHGAYIDVGNNLSVISGGDIIFDAIKEIQSSSSFGKNHENKSSSSMEHEHVIGSELYAGGDINLVALGVNSSINILASYIGSDNGAINLMASNDVLLSTVGEKHQLFTTNKTKNENFLSSNKKFNTDQTTEVDAIGSVISGNIVSIVASRDVTVVGSTVVGDRAVSMIAGRDIVINAATNTFDTTDLYKEKHTGISSTNNNERIGFIYSTTNTKDNVRTNSTIASESNIVAVNGDVTLTAEKDISITGSFLFASQDLTLLAKSISIANATEQQHFQEDYIQHQRGLIITVSNPLVAKTTDSINDVKRAEEVSDSRLKAMYDYRAAHELIAVTNNSSSEMDGLIIQSGLFDSKTHLKSEIDNTTTVSSNLTSGHDMKIISTQDDVTIIGSNLSAKNILITSARDVLIQSADNMSKTQESNLNRTNEIGFYTGESSGVYINANSNSQTKNAKEANYQEASIRAEDTLKVTGSRDVTFQGAEISANKIIATIGHDLNLISQQDTAQFKQKDKNIAFESHVTIFGATENQINGSYNQSTIQSNYKSVQEQTILKAGSEGFDIYVGNNTNLVGTVIESSADISKNSLSTETFSYSNIYNNLNINNSTEGLSYQSQHLTPNIGVASNQNDSSTTYSAMSTSELAIRSNNTTDISHDTSNANHALENKFSLEQTEQQRELSSLFGTEANQLVGDIAEWQILKNGSIEKIVMHSVVGGIEASFGGGNVFSGVVGAGMSEAMQNMNVQSEWTSIAIGAGVGVLAGSYQSGAATAYDAYLHNCLAHECLNYYMEGSGAPLEADFFELGADKVKAEDFKAIQELLAKDLPDGIYEIEDAHLDWRTKSLNAQASYGNVILELNGTLTISQGNYNFDGALSAKQDLYDFDPKPWGVRNFLAEVSTRIGAMLPGKPYYMLYAGNRKLHSDGSMQRKE